MGQGGREGGRGIGRKGGGGKWGARKKTFKGVFVFIHMTGDSRQDFRILLNRLILSRQSN